MDAGKQRSKVVRLKPGTTIVCRTPSDGNGLELVFYSEREASEQHLDAHDREARTPVDGSDSDAA